MSIIGNQLCHSSNICVALPELLSVPSVISESVILGSTAPYRKSRLNIVEVVSELSLESILGFLLANLEWHHMIYLQGLLGFLAAVTG